MNLNNLELADRQVLWVSFLNCKTRNFVFDVKIDRRTGNYLIVLHFEQVVLMLSD